MGLYSGGLSRADRAMRNLWVLSLWILLEYAMWGAAQRGGKYNHSNTRMQGMLALKTLHIFTIARIIPLHVLLPQALLHNTATHYVSDLGVFAVLNRPINDKSQGHGQSIFVTTQGNLYTYTCNTISAYTHWEGYILVYK